MHWDAQKSSVDSQHTASAFLLLVHSFLSSPRKALCSPALRRGPDGSHGGPECQHHGPQRGQNLPGADFNAEAVLGAHCHDPHRDAAHRHHTEQAYNLVKRGCDEQLLMLSETNCSKKNYAH